MPEERLPILNLTLPPVFKDSSPICLQALTLMLKLNLSKFQSEPGTNCSDANGRKSSDGDLSSEKPVDMEAEKKSRYTLTVSVK